MGAISGGLLGAMTEAGIFLFDVSGVGFPLIGNLPGIYPWTSLHIFPLVGLVGGGGLLGGTIGTLMDAIAVVNATTVGVLTGVGASLSGYLMGLLFTK